MRRTGPARANARAVAPRAAQAGSTRGWNASQFQINAGNQLTRSNRPSRQSEGMSDPFAEFVTDRPSRRKDQHVSRRQRVQSADHQRLDNRERENSPAAHRQTAVVRGNFMMFTPPIRRVAGRPGQVPEIVMPPIKIVGQATEPRNSRSSATASIFSSISLRFPAIVTSETG